MYLDDALPFVTNEVGSCPDVVIKQQMILALQEFCRETRCWAQQLDLIQLQAGQREYDATPDSNNARVHTLDRVECIGYGPLQLLDATQERPADWVTATGPMPRRVYAAADGQTFTIYPEPQGDQLPLLLVHVRLVPKLTATSVPDEVLEKHIEAVASGTKARLMAMPNRPWTDINAAATHRGLFVSAMTDARAASSSTYVSGPTFVTPPTFG